MAIIKAADQTNKKQRNLFVKKITKYFGEDLTGKTFAVWGLAFKPKTDDMREAPAITIINALLEKGAKIKAFDPKAMESAKFYFADRIIYSKSSYEALEEADALLLLTEWNEFRRPDFERVKSIIKAPVIFDGRNQYESKRLAEKGFEYFSIGRVEG
jgi:UDPglucose 6-dehydrogenase